MYVAKHHHTYNTWYVIMVMMLIETQALGLLLGNKSGCKLQLRRNIMLELLGQGRGRRGKGKEDGCAVICPLSARYALHTYKYS